MTSTYIRKKLEELMKESREHKRLALCCSYVRLGAMLGIVFGIYQGYYREKDYGYPLAFLFLLLFFAAAVYHYHQKKRIEELQALKECYQDIEKRKSSEWKQFSDQGEDFLSKDSRQERDLDIFGRASLFQYVSCAKTPLGRSRLAELLTWKQQGADAIRSRQEAVRECAEKKGFTMTFLQLSKLFEQHALRKKKERIENFFEDMEQGGRLYPKAVQTLCTLVSAAVLATLVASAFLPIATAYFTILFVLSLAGSYLLFMKNNALLSSAASAAAILQDYKRMLKLLVHTDLSSAYLCALQKQCAHAEKGIASLQNIVMLVQARSNVILHILLNGFFLADLQCVFALESWKQRYGGEVREWLQAVGECEALASLAQLAFVKENVCLAEVRKEEAPSFHFRDMHHPLLEEEKAVCNSFDAKAKTYILTGSNMSGKTTFLRTIGINMILFHAGGFVCAREAAAGSMSVYTSMRVQDDVSEGISTFYAEILRIRDMMLAAERRESMLVLIDEIFKGTNSADRIVCALTAMKRLHLPWVSAFVSTHDFELCDLEKELDAENYHFSEYYEGDRICFDYLLKTGRCTTTNAKQLMKLAGF